MSCIKENYVSASIASTSQTPRVKAEPRLVKQYTVHSDAKRRFFINIVIIDGMLQISIENSKCIFQTNEFKTDLAGYAFPLAEWNKFAAAMGAMFDKMTEFQEGRITLTPPKTTRDESESEIKSVFSEKFYKTATHHFSLKVIDVNGAKYVGIQMWHGESRTVRWKLGLRGFFLELSVWTGEFRRAFESVSKAAMHDIRPLAGRRMTAAARKLLPLSIPSNSMCSASTRTEKDDSPPPKKLQIVDIESPHLDQYGSSTWATQEIERFEVCTLTLGV